MSRDEGSRERDERDEIEIFQNLVVFGVEVEGDEVRADVYGGDESICGTVLYRLERRDELENKVATLRRWHAEGTPVTYVRRGRSAALLDEVAMLTDALNS